ncbi:MAG: polyribonucleotide nucleotidyltransferase [Erysipelotrichaceae bacterium]|nr:polyribonucleotide nucleotidyltransferase [Erysipelotrichaceae bacterium]MDY3829372.1 polyribonucleotide nucleotidyltransferase [Erysipelotrichaceae bacterium]
MAKEVFSMNFDGKNITVETGELAKQARGAVLVRYEDTVVLSTACASNVAKDTDFFPLTVSFEEKLYSVGKIPGGFLRREGRPSEHATLTARLIDRPIRPLFADGFRNEVQVVNTALSVDQNYPAEMAAMLGASLALSISDIPFEGPIAGVEVGCIDGEFVINPNVEQKEKSTLSLTMAGKKDAIMMVEAGSKEVSEELMVEALAYGQTWIKKLCEFEEEIIAKVGKEKMEVVLYEVPQSLKQDIYSYVFDRLKAAVSIKDKLECNNTIDALTAETIDFFAQKEYENEAEKNKTLKMVNEVCTQIVADEVRRLIVEDKIRPDGRAVDEIRPLDAQIDILPRVHGSGLFTRGQTQVLSATTLGALGDNQIIDDLTEVEEKRFMHHYNFPPYSVGEVGRMGTPGRREIGHGALGERALKQVLPSEEEFPYAIRTVAEVLESNGSSSQASICAGTLSLMAAGVPIKAPVAGIAMGLIENGGNYTILTDIQGMEDHFGDMDFKVAGTREGITALQMDIKVQGLDKKVLAEAMQQAKKARMQILDVMEKAIAQPRKEVSQYAPKIAMMQIPPEKIRDVIGTGGKNINQIIEASNQTKIDISDEGKVVIYHVDQASIDIARSMIEAIVREAKVGEVYENVKVVRVESFGIFVELFANTDAMVHVSDLRWEKVAKPSSLYKVGDIVEKVIVKEIDEKGRINASIKDLLEKPKDYQEPIRDYSNNKIFTGGKSSFKRRNNKKETV